MFDYHVHTTQSADCSTPILASCRAAITAGVTEIAFTDHIEHEPADMSFGFFNYDQYINDLESARDRYGDQLTILSGAEVDFNTGIANQVEDFLSNHDFDFVIGSVHYAEAGEIIFPEYFRHRSMARVLDDYFKQIDAAAKTTWFDSIGHIDLPKRYAPPTAGPYVPGDFEDQLRQVLRTLIATGTSFEINTSGLRQAPRTSMPGPQIVRMYVEEGGTMVTVGSDSHVPETIGAGMDRTLAMLRLCGVTHISSFRKRVRTRVPIDSVVNTLRVG